MDIFISYSHKDHVWKERVGLFMQCMRRQGHFDYNTWDDGDINISEHWEQRIREAINRAKIAVLLISPDFLTSRFIMEKELPLLLQRKQEGLLAIVPVIVRPSPWEVIDWLSPIQLHPPGGQALSGGTEYQIEENLKTLTIEVHRLLKQSLPPPPPTPPTTSNEPIPPGPLGPDAFEFIGEAGVRELIQRQFNELVLDVLLLYEVTNRQNVWLATTRSSIYCIIDDRHTTTTGKKVQWRQAIVPGLPVVARATSRLPNRAGTVDIGNRQNWLYSLKSYPNPIQLESSIRQMIDRAIRS